MDISIRSKIPSVVRSRTHSVRKPWKCQCLSNLRSARLQRLRRTCVALVIYLGVARLPCALRALRISIGPVEIHHAPDLANYISI